MLGLGHEVWSDEVKRGWDSLGAPTIAMVAQQWREACDAIVQGEDPGHAETLSGTNGMSMAVVPRIRAIIQHIYIYKAAYNYGNG